MPLIKIDSADYGDPKSKMKLVELERNAKTSKIRLTYEKMGSSVGSSMFIVRAFYEIAKARGTEYFTNLKEWQEPDGSRIYIAGFTDTKDADIKKEFGEEFEYNNEYGPKRIFMSISQLKTIFTK
ncbi:MAG: hypothetical protein A2X48_08975 [Lentisphaerae bacterium GWF2_49_21]|nr:MAG: hypothetical protein A2X48_08975 [Lentisphaerae bacterium GWF2_49_21]